MIKDRRHAQTWNIWWGWTGLVMSPGNYITGILLKWNCHHSLGILTLSASQCQCHAISWCKPPTQHTRNSYVPFHFTLLHRNIHYLVITNTVTFFKKIDSRERKGGSGREVERNIDWLPPACLPEPATWICALIGNQICHLLVYGMRLLPTKPHQPGQ